MSERSFLKVLLACARPLVAREKNKLVPLDTIRPGEEIEAIKNGLKGIKREIHVTTCAASTFPEIERALRNSEPEFDVLHFMGHGDEETGGLFFEGDCGIARLVKPDELVRIIKGRAKLLVIMACFSEKAVNKLFAGKGRAPVEAAICIERQYPIPVLAAELFSGALYSGLSRGKSLKDSFSDALDAVRIDDMVGENNMPDTDETSSPWKRFVLKGDDKLFFPDMPSGSVHIEDLIKKSHHKRIAPDDELFVGRREDIVALARALEPPLAGTRHRKPRIVTLWGEGGMGKTRLAHAVAQWLAERGKFPGGIFEIAFDGVIDVRGLVIAILEGLGMENAGGIPEQDKALMAKLSTFNERTLLVLDNLDQLFDPSTSSGEAGILLKNCLTASPCLNILATCRWELKLGTDENAFMVDPMSFADGLKLFIECIPDSDIREEFNQIDDPEKLKALAEILKLMSMMPLCIILAARRLTRHVESLETLLKKAAGELVETLENPEMKHLPERLRSLRASLDLSYNRLSEDAKRLLARMSFFPGGLFRKLDLWELLGDTWQDSAEELTRYSLVRYSRDRERYSMLYPMLEYAKDKLNSGEGDKFRKNASVFWADFARWNDLMLDVKPASQERAARLLNLPDDPEERREKRTLRKSEAFAAFTAEEENLIHTALWALNAKDEAGLGLVDSLEDYLDLRAGWYTKERLYRLALERRRELAKAKPDEYMPDLAMTLGNMGNLQQRMGHPDEALEYYREVLDKYRKLSQAHPDAYMPDVAATLNNMGVLLTDMSRLNEALVHCKEAMEIYRNFFQRYPSAHARNFMGTLGNALEVYEKLGMKEKAEECRREMEKVSD